MSELKWEPNGTDTYATSECDRSPHGTIPYMVDKRHDGFALTSNIFLRGIETPERAQEIAQGIEDALQGSSAERIVAYLQHHLDELLESHQNLGIVTGRNIEATFEHIIELIESGEWRDQEVD